MGSEVSESKTTCLSVQIEEEEAANNEARWGNSTELVSLPRDGTLHKEGLRWMKSPRMDGEAKDEDVKESNKLFGE